MKYEKWFLDALKSVENTDKGTLFAVKDLFSGTKWNTLSPGEKKSFGRYFSAKVKDGEVQNVIREGETKGHHNKYRKI